MRHIFSLLLVLSVLVTAGCIQEYADNSTMTTATTLTPSPVMTTVSTPAPQRAEMAYLAGIQCTLDPTTERAYHCNGNVRIRSGASREVQVIARYPDNNTFYGGSAAMGGSNPIAKPFVVFPDLKYQGQDPDWFVKLDNTTYKVTWSGDTGVAWSDLLPA